MDPVANTYSRNHASLIHELIAHEREPSLRQIYSEFIRVGVMSKPRTPSASNVDFKAIERTRAESCAQLKALSMNAFARGSATKNAPSNPVRQ